MLALQLPFAGGPLVLLVRSGPRMGLLKAPGWMTGLAAAIAALLIGLNVKIVVDFMGGS